MLQKIIVYVLCLIYFVESQNKTGDPCTLDGSPGRCVEMKKCYYLIETFKLKEEPQFCSSDGDEPLVCCSDCKLVDDINQITVDPQRGPLYKDGRKSWDYCLDNIKSLPYPCKKSFVFSLVKEWIEKEKCHEIRYTAIGGRTGDEEVKEFPHMALLGYGDELENLNWDCAGSIISDRFILTAAHCGSDPRYGSVTYAALGVLKRSDPQNLWKRHRIQDIILHPEYKAPSRYHDIALLRTAESIQFFEDVLPACLPSEKTNIIATLNSGAVGGWGSSDHEKGLTGTLKKVTVEKYSSEKCSTLYEPNRVLTNGFNSTTQICYGRKNQTCYGETCFDLFTDACEGDSGGPLHVNNGCAFDVIGVTSLGGHPCRSPFQSGIYTLVEPYVPWIESIVWP